MLNQWKLPYQYLSKIPSELPLDVLFSIGKLQNQTIPLRWTIPKESQSLEKTKNGKPNSNQAMKQIKCMNFKTSPANSCMNLLRQGNLQTTHKRP